MKYNYDKNFHVDINYVNNEKAINLRLEKSELKTGQQINTLENILKFIYLIEYQGKAYGATIKKYVKQNLLTEVEGIVANRLATRCTGSEKERYGFASVVAMKRDGFHCVIPGCDVKDIRCLEIDHKGGRTKAWYEVDDFQTLCSNHHRIKTVVEKQQNQHE